MLRLAILAGLITTTVSAFLLGAVFGLTLAAGYVPGAPAAAEAVQADPPDAADGTAVPAAAAGPAPSTAVAARESAAGVGGPGAPLPADPAAATLPTPDPDPRIAALQAPRPETYTLSAGTFAQPAEARRFTDTLTARSMPAQVLDHVDDRGRTWSEVTVGPYASSGSATLAAQEIRRAFAIAPVLRVRDIVR